jgi:hypothetical protein
MTITPLSFDDPKPEADTRKMQQISLRPSLKAKIDAERGRMSRSEWIERAIIFYLRERKP